MTLRTSIERLSDDAPVPHIDSWPARRPPFIEQHYAECPDCGAPEAATRVLGFSCEHRRCPMFERRPPPSPARASARAALEAQAKETAAWLVTTQHRDGVIPPAERIVLDCLRALQAIPASERLYADALTGVISRGYLDTAWGARTSRRRVTALLRIASEAAT